MLDAITFSDQTFKVGKIFRLPAMASRRIATMATLPQGSSTIASARSRLPTKGPAPYQGSVTVAQVRSYLTNKSLSIALQLISNCKASNHWHSSLSITLACSLWFQLFSLCRAQVSHSSCSVFFLFSPEEKSQKQLLTCHTVSSYLFIPSLFLLCFSFQHLKKVSYLKSVELYYTQFLNYKLLSVEQKDNKIGHIFIFG